MTYPVKSIVLVTHYYPEHGGGIERVAFTLGSHLAQASGWQIVWLASNSDAPPTHSPVTMSNRPARAWNGIERCLGIPWPVWSPSSLLALWQEISNSSLVHLHDALYFGNVFAWLFARLRGVPVVITQHVGSIPFRSRILRLVHAIANRTLGRLVLSTASQTIFISPAVRDEFAGFCHFRTPPVYWPNGVDTGVFHSCGASVNLPAIETARARGRRVFIFVGRFVEKKGLNILHRLAQAFPDDLWIFAGHGPLDPTNWKLANVLVVRGKSGVELACYYRAADLLVLPSVGEGFPLVVQEAMACGTPAMVSEETAAGSPEARSLMLVEKILGDNPANLWIARLSELQKVELQALRSAVATFAQQCWSWETVAGQYSALFKSIAVTKKG